MSEESERSPRNKNYRSITHPMGKKIKKKKEWFRAYEATLDTYSSGHSRHSPTGQNVEDQKSEQIATTSAISSSQGEASVEPDGEPDNSTHPDKAQDTMQAETLEEDSKTPTVPATSSSTWQPWLRSSTVETEEFLCKTGSGSLQSPKILTSNEESAVSADPSEVSPPDDLVSENQLDDVNLQERHETNTKNREDVPPESPKMLQQSDDVAADNNETNRPVLRQRTSINWVPLTDCEDSAEKKKIKYKKKNKCQGPLLQDHFESSVQERRQSAVKRADSNSQKASTENSEFGPSKEGNESWCNADSTRDVEELEDRHQSAVHRASSGNSKIRRSKENDQNWSNTEASRELEEKRPSLNSSESVAENELQDRRQSAVHRASNGNSEFRPSKKSDESWCNADFSGELEEKRPFLNSCESIAEDERPNPVLESSQYNHTSQPYTAKKLLNMAKVEKDLNRISSSQLRHKTFEPVEIQAQHVVSDNSEEGLKGCKTIKSNAETSTRSDEAEVYAVPPENSKVLQQSDDVVADNNEEDLKGCETNGRVLRPRKSINWVALMDSEDSTEKKKRKYKKKNKCQGPLLQDHSQSSIQERRQSAVKKTNRNYQKTSNGNSSKENDENWSNTDASRELEENRPSLNSSELADEDELQDHHQSAVHKASNRNSEFRAFKESEESWCNADFLGELEEKRPFLLKSSQHKHKSQPYMVKKLLKMAEVEKNLNRISSSQLRDKTFEPVVIQAQHVVSDNNEEGLKGCETIKSKVEISTRSGEAEVDAVPPQNPQVWQQSDDVVADNNEEKLSFKPKGCEPKKRVLRPRKSINWASLMDFEDSTEKKRKYKKKNKLNVKCKQPLLQDLSQSSIQERRQSAVKKTNRNYQKTSDGNSSKENWSITDASRELEENWSSLNSSESTGEYELQDHRQSAVHRASNGNSEFRPSKESNEIWCNADSSRDIGEKRPFLNLSEFAAEDERPKSVLESSQHNHKSQAYLAKKRRGSLFKMAQVKKSCNRLSFSQLRHKTLNPPKRHKNETESSGNNGKSSKADSEVDTQKKRRGRPPKERKNTPKQAEHKAGHQRGVNILKPVAIGAQHGVQANLVDEDRASEKSNQLALPSSAENTAVAPQKKKRKRKFNRTGFPTIRKKKKIVDGRPSPVLDSSQHSHTSQAYMEKKRRGSLLETAQVKITLNSLSSSQLRYKTLNSPKRNKNQTESIGSNEKSPEADSQVDTQKSRRGRPSQERKANVIEEDSASDNSNQLALPLSAEKTTVAPQKKKRKRKFNRTGFPTIRKKKKIVDERPSPVLVSYQHSHKSQAYVAKERRRSLLETAQVETRPDHLSFSQLRQKTLKSPKWNTNQMESSGNNEKSPEADSQVDIQKKRRGCLPQERKSTEKQIGHKAGHLIEEDGTSDKSNQLALPLSAGNTAVAPPKKKRKKNFNRTGFPTVRKKKKIVVATVSTNCDF